MGGGGGGGGRTPKLAVPLFSGTLQTLLMPKKKRVTNTRQHMLLENL